jgi:hypothetical protein
MSFGKPFRAAPVRLGARYQAKTRRARRNRAVQLLAFAAAASMAAVGLLAAVADESGPSAPDQASLSSAARGIAQRSVYYPYCDAARAAGAAPILAGQPGYRPELDRDGDGIACEPYRGQ